MLFHIETTSQYVNKLTMELSQSQLLHLLKRFPSFELSYETLTHKKVPSNYDICLGIPSGRKYFVWFTFYKDTDVCYLLELNKEKRIVRGTVTPSSFSSECHIGTIFYGSIVREDVPIEQTENNTPLSFFVIEDIYYYKGIPLKHVCFAQKIPILKRLFVCDKKRHMGGASLSCNNTSTPTIVDIYLPFMWTTQQPVPKIPYTIHHIQYRETTRICPHLNVLYGLRDPTIIQTTNLPIIPQIYVSQYIPQYNKPQYRYPTIFRVIADVQYDIYHLYACGQPSVDSTTSATQPRNVLHVNANHKSGHHQSIQRTYIYYDVAYIPNYEKSVFMNSLFRNIRENRNLDYIEESDDEEEFENTTEDKYVDLKKELIIECVFHPKFKRWVPMRVMTKFDKVVHINKLTR
jgi:hypothetical protein